MCVVMQGRTELCKVRGIDRGGVSGLWIKHTATLHVPLSQQANRLAFAKPFAWRGTKDNIKTRCDRKPDYCIICAHITSNTTAGSVLDCAAKVCVKSIFMPPSIVRRVCSS